MTWHDLVTGPSAVDAAQRRRHLRLVPLPAVPGKALVLNQLKMVVIRWTGELFLLTRMLPCRGRLAPACWVASSGCHLSALIVTVIILL